jgi:pimeloyl-ACP methyl ester carboxylesterase
LIFTVDNLKKIIDLIIQKESLSGQISEHKFSLMGYSLGGRVALSLYEQIPGNISKLILLAPDGLKVNFWYWLATQTYLGNRLFAFTMKNPKWYFKLLNAFHYLGFVNNSIYKFVKAYIDDEQVRNELYSRWTSFRKIKPSIPKIKQQITEFNTDILFIYGRHDRIIRYERAERFIKGIENQCDLNIINAGHRVLNKKHAGEILAALLR